MRIGLINVGDELLAGKILNTNARDLGLWLRDLGHELAFAATLPDGAAALSAALEQALRSDAGFPPRCDLLLLSGGLGPTQDDLTRDGIAEFLGSSLEPSAEAEAWLTEWLKIGRQELTQGQRTQLLVPRGAAPLRNPAGTACGLAFTAGGCRVFAFAGVPSEFRALFDAHCRPLLEASGARMLRRSALTFGLAESRQREFLEGYAPPEPLRYSSLPNDNGVTISLECLVPAADSGGTEGLLEDAWNALLGRLPPECVVSRDGASLSETVFRLLRARGRTVSTAESCTAGAAAFLLTETPGSSGIFRRGWLVYSDEAKRELLGVPDGLLREHGAVSEPVALAMARGCLAASGSDYAIAVTGIAGPGGATPEKPVGLVYIAVASAAGATCRRHFLRGDRDSIRWKSAYSALNDLRLALLDDPK